MCVCNDSMIYNDNTMSNNLQNRNKTSLNQIPAKQSNSLLNLFGLETLGKTRWSQQTFKND